MGKTLTRVAFCQKCYDSKRPERLSSFAAFGATRQLLLYKTYDLSGSSAVRGFVPHLFFFLSLNRNGNYVVKKHCAMNGCGTTFSNETDTEFDVEFNDAEMLIMTPAEWIDLERFTDTGYKL